MHVTLKAGVKHKNNVHGNQISISLATIDGGGDQLSQRKNHTQNVAAINYHGNLY